MVWYEPACRCETTSPMKLEPTYLREMMMLLLTLTLTLTTYLREMMSRLPRLLSFAQFWHYRPSAVRRMITHIERVWQTTFMDAWLRQPASDMMMFGYPHVINATDGWEDNAPTYRFIDAWDDLQVSLTLSY